jgi:hypothetical protein
LRGHRFNDVKNEVATITGRCDVQEREFVGALFVVSRSNFNGIAGIAKFYKVNALDHAATGDIKARNDSFG